MALAKGITARAKVHTPQGEITRKRWDEDREVFEYLLAYTGADGEEHQAWFAEDELEEVSPDA